MNAPTRAVSALADVILRAQQQGRQTPMGIAFAIDAARMVMSPETAAELDRLRTRVTELEQLLAEGRPADEDPIAYELTAEAGKVTRPSAGGIAQADAEPAAELTVYRASHESIDMGLYTSPEAAREHCETVLRREYDESTKASLWWRGSEEAEDQDGEVELFAHVTPQGFDRGHTWRSGYVVTPLTVASAYDEEADE